VAVKLCRKCCISQKIMKTNAIKRGSQKTGCEKIVQRNSIIIIIIAEMQLSPKGLF